MMSKKNLNKFNINQNEQNCHGRDSKEFGSDERELPYQKIQDVCIEFKPTEEKDFEFKQFKQNLDQFHSNNKLSSASQKHHIVDKNAEPISYGTYDDHYNNQNRPINNRQPPSTNNNNNNDSVSVSDIIGSFGWFQFLILLFSGLRESSVGYDAVVMSVVLQPIDNFYCADGIAGGFKMTSYANNTQQFNETHQCFQAIEGHMLLDAHDRPIECNSWIFLPQQDGTKSLIEEWLLVCHRHWLVAFVESAYFMGLVTGNLVWGFYADRIGRRRAYLVAHSIALIFGWGSILAPTIWVFAMCRFFSAFGAISYNIIYTIQIELIGQKHRSFSTLLNHMGWGLGVIAVPLANHLFSDYRYMIAFAPILSLLMFPWAFWLPESSRWLMSQNNFAAARHELIRAAKFNGRKVTPLLEKKISLLRQKVIQDKMNQYQLKLESNMEEGNKRPYRTIFKNPTLLRDTLVLSYISFIGHLFYYMLTINFGYIENLSIEANFITSGAGEWVSVVVGAILLKLTTRKTCMSIFLLVMSLSFIVQFLIDLEIESLSKILDGQVVITTINGIGTLSALLVIFVTLIVNQEVYPTFIRQTGSSLVNTIAESGSTLAPLLIQFGRLIGPSNADLLYTLISLVGIVMVQFLTKTDDIELPDA